MITKVILISKNDKIVYSTEQTQLAEKIRQELYSWEEQRLKAALERNDQDPFGDYDDIFTRTLDGKSCLIFKQNYNKDQNILNAKNKTH